MRRLLAAGLCTAAASVLFFPAPPLSGQGASLRERSQVSSAPGTLARLGEKRFDRLSVEATSVDAGESAWGVDPATGARFRKDALLVQFTDGADAGTRAQAAREAGGTRMPIVLPGNWEVVSLSPGSDVRAAASALRGRPGIAQVSLDYRAVPEQVRPNDEHFGIQWNFDAINLPLAWQINPGAASDVVVAVIDTGMNTESATLTFSTPIGFIPIRFAAAPDLPTGTRLVRPFDFVYGDDFPADLDGHGTHVAGTVAQQTNNTIGAAGVAYNVGLMPLKALSSDWDDVLFPANNGGAFSMIAEAVRYAADNGAKVINLSLSGPVASAVMRDAITYAVGRGAFVVMAAGNQAEDGNPVRYPAAYASEIEGAMTVGAVNRSLTRASYSNFHPYVEICAPGGQSMQALDYQQAITQISYDDDFSLTYLGPLQMVSALRQGLRPSFEQFMPLPISGTSMATPHVAGVAALMYSQGIRNPRAIEQAIKRFATPISARADECGAGLVDARRVVRGLGLAR